MHVNNFDIILSDKDGKDEAIKFLMKLEMFTNSRCIFLFWDKNLFKDVISARQRVKVFLSTPLMVNPLSKTEIVRAFEERMQLLKSEDVVSYIKPVRDEVIYRIYDLYNGDIRSLWRA